MKLAFLFYPVKDLDGSVAFYKGLGMEEAWRADEFTAALRIPDADVKIMLEQDEVENSLTPGGVSGWTVWIVFTNNMQISFVFPSSRVTCRRAAMPHLKMTRVTRFEL